ncbi:MAG: hypothetical protein HYU39_07510 [Thaumarchaeota archaeon]|nr:hypothetical protein [Nitrososphaerota archaeon]
MRCIEPSCHLEPLTEITTHKDDLTDQTYDKAGNLLTVKDAKGQLTRFYYDDLNRNIKTTFPDNKNQTGFYDVLGNVVGVKDSNGNSTSFAYDEGGRLFYAGSGAGRDNLVAWWLFDEGLGGSVRDSSDNKNSGVLVNGPVWVEGKQGRALSFDGVDDSADFGDKAGFRFGGGSFSLSAWVKTSSASNQGIIDKKFGFGAGVAGYSLFVNTNGNLRYQISDGASQNDNNAGVVRDGNWHHVAMVRNASSSRVNLYVDGVQVLSDSTTVGNLDNAQSLYVGYGAGGGNFFPGSIDDVKVFSRALGAAEVLAEYRSQGVSVIYDKMSNRVSMSDSASAATYGYDALNRLLSEAKTVDGSQYTTSFTYDAGSRVTKLTYPDAYQLSYQYDDLDRVKSLGGFANFTYTKDNKVKTITYGNGIQTTYTYDLRSRATRILVQDGSTTKLDLNYAYKGNGDVESIDDGYAPTDETYSYDGLDRLTSSTGPWGTISYTYDQVGNRLTKTEGSTTSYTYGTYNRLTQAGSTNYTYDNNGNMITKNDGTDSWTYTYDYNNMMTKAVKNSVTQGQYFYDCDNRRVKTIESGSTTILWLHSKSSWWILRFVRDGYCTISLIVD